MEHKIEFRKPKRKWVNRGLTFKAKAMGIRHDTLYRYLTERQPKPKDFEERYAIACGLYESHLNSKKERQ